MPNTPSKRKIRRRKSSASPIGLYALIAAGVMVVVVLLVLAAKNTPGASAAAAPNAPLMGEAVAISSATHISTDQTPGPYSSSPPAGGPHYAESWTAHFYEESELASLPPNPTGYLVHSLEHGYVIFWYNCGAAGADCNALKASIRQVMDATGGTKLIAFPYTDMKEPLAMTSWGRILRFDQPDTKTMQAFVESNRYKAPEPNAE